MCPVCVATAALLAGKVTTASGVAAIAIRRFGVKNAAADSALSTPSRLSRTKNGAGEIVPDADQRRDEDVNEHD